VLYNTRNLIYTPQVTNDHWKASTSSRNSSSVSSVSNRAVFCLSGQQFIFFVFFIFTERNISRCAPKRFSYLSLHFIRQRLLLLWNERVDTIILCSHNVIRSNPILTSTYSRISWVSPAGCSNNQKCKTLCVAVRRPKLVALPCAVPQSL